MAKASRKFQEGPRILTTRREALHLYREIRRYTNLFVWKDDKGVMWRDVLRANARKEYEAARHENDPEIINKLIITGRDAVHRVVESFWRRRNQIIQDEASRQESSSNVNGGRGGLSAPGYEGGGSQKSS
ncbi:hypothetical protein CEUSTIGMA_g293.t1 [Chlamydomonas eustigma]|uniref:Complex 1 LYR protein domain-containing protein n=1 Tax=Chlamydomonas eustigma TaxID=1157962 RepID=A0A250WPT3_9CHLO|nr:hypothetical protein CEUSTIGMA_g293.t1 [Chlamydomonas eustigma]|eukprot:GAX72838.1 hypothetical protein CEUSTIGMA_g293.t1 [Chlamydomonas eustigma]